MLGKAERTAECKVFASLRKCKCSTENHHLYFSCVHMHRNVKSSVKNRVLPPWGTYSSHVRCLELMCCVYFQVQKRDRRARKIGAADVLLSLELPAAVLLVVASAAAAALELGTNGWVDCVPLFEQVQ